MPHPSAHTEVGGLFAYGDFLFWLADLTRSWRGERHVTGDLIEMSTGRRHSGMWIIPPGHDRSSVSALVDLVLQYELGPLTA